MSVTTLIRKNLIAALIVGCTSVAAPGCLSQATRGPAEVGQGEHFRTGDPTFDEFFDLIHDEQVRLGGAPNREKGIRRRLARKLGIDSEASASRLGREVAERTQRLEAGGTGIKLQVTGADGTEEDDATAKVVSAGSVLNSDGRALVKNLEKTAARAAQLQAAMTAAKQNTDSLVERLSLLDGKVDATFTDANMRNRVRKNLDDARKLLPMMQERAGKIGRRAERLVSKLVDGASSDLSQYYAKAAPRPPVARPTAPAKRPAPGPRPTPGAKPPPPPEPKPAAPPPSSDFEP